MKRHQVSSSVFKSFVFFSTNIQEEAVQVIYGKLRKHKVGKRREISGATNGDHKTKGTIIWLYQRKNKKKEFSLCY